MFMIIMYHLNVLLSSIYLHYKQLKNLGFLTQATSQIKGFIESAKATSTALDFSQMGASLSQFSASTVAAAANMAGLTAEQTASTMAAAGFTTSETAAAMAAAGFDAAAIAAGLSANGLAAGEIAATMAASGFEATAIAAALATTGLGEAEIIAALEATGLSTAEAAAAVAAAGFGAAATGATGATLGFAASLKAAATGLATFLLTNPVGWAILAAGAIFGAVKAVDALTESFDEACDSADDARQTLKNAEADVRGIEQSQASLRTQVESLAGEYNVEFTDEDTIQDIINKLKELNLSTADAQTLSSLEQQTAQLESQYQIKKKIADYDRQEAGKAAQHVLDKPIQEWLNEYDEYGNQKLWSGTIIDQTKRKQQELNAVEQEYSQLLQDHADTQVETSKWWQGATQWEQEESRLAALESKRDTLTEDIADNLGIISENYDSLLDSEGNPLPGMEQTAKNVETVYQKVLEADEANEQLAESENEAAEAAESYSSAVAGIAEEAKATVSSINAITDAMNAQTTGKSLSLDTYNSEELKDYSSALEYHNGVMQYNAEKVREITKAKAAEEKATIAANKAQDQSKYLENAGKIEQLRTSLATASASEKAAIQENINSLLAENAALVDSCNQYDIITASINQATGAYQNWLNAQSASQSGEMFDSSLQAITKINDTLNNADSESYGRIGNADYKAALEFVIPESVDTSDEAAINSYMDSVKQYLTFDDKGSANGLDIAQFCQNAVDAGLMTLDESGESYQIAGQKTMQDFADGLNLSLPFVQAIFGEMEEFGGEFDWADESVKTMGDLGMAANEAAESLRNIKGNEDFKIAMDVSSFDDANLACETLDTTIQEMNDLKAQPDVDTSQIEQANTVIQYCVAQKQMLNMPAIMSVDTSQVNTSIGEAIFKLQEFQTAQNNLEMQSAIDVDTSDAESKVNSLASEIDGLSPEVKAKLGINTSSVDSIQSYISGLDAEAIVKLGIDSSLIDGYTPKDPDATVKYGIDSSKPDGYKPEDKKAVVTYDCHHSAVDSYNPSNLTRTVTYNIVTKGSPPSGGTHEVNGTAHARGTAYAGGNWGNAPGGTTLVGELGQEIVVDPRTGKWYTVGDNGAEFRDIPRGAIVFNHLQSKSLLQNGYALGRATALASGTAMVSGGIKVKQTTKTNTKQHTSPTSSDDKKSTTKKKTTKKKDKKNTKDAIDWVERRLKYFGDKVKSIADTITDYVSLATKKAKLIAERTAIGKEISANESGYSAYMSKAKGVKLSASLKKKVREGNYSIKDYGENTRKAIEKYKEYYDKAQECKSKVTELRNEQLKLFEELMAIPAEKAAKKIDKLSKSYDTLSAKSSAAATGMSGIQALMKLGSKSVDSAKSKRDEALAEKNNAKAKYDSATSTAKAAKTKTQKAAKKLTKKDKKIKKDKNGYYILSGLKKNSAQYKRLKAYNDALKAQKNAEKKQASAKKTYSSASSAYSVANGNYKSLKDLYDTSFKGETYEYQNALIDQELSNKKSQNSANQTALKEANANLTAAQSSKNSADKKVSDKASSILKSYGKKLTSAQKKALQSGKTVSTKGLSGKALKAAQAYNKLVSTATTKAKELTLAQEAQAEAAETAAQSAAELAEAQVQAEKDKFDNVKNYYESQLSYLDALNAKRKALNDLNATKGIAMTADDYKSLISDTQTQISTLSTESQKLKDQLAASVKSGVIKKDSEEWKAMNAEIQNVETSIYNAQQQQEEYNNAIASMPFEKIEKQISLLDAIASYNQSVRDLAEAQGKLLSEKDYTNQMSENNQKIDKYLEERKEAWQNYQNALAASTNKNLQVYGGKTADEWKEDYLGFDTEINNLKADNEELKKSLRDDVYWRNFERAHDACENIKNILEGLSDLIEDDMVFDKNGNFTEYGISKIANLTKQYENARKEVQNYQNDLDNLNKLYREGYYTQDEYTQKLHEIQGDMLSSASSMKSYITEITELYKEQAKSELDALEKLIDARSEALKKKKEYYDYDKTIRSQTNDIQNLQAQLAALDGIETAEAKAKKATLKSQLDEKQADLDDTVNDHLMDLSQDALDDLKDVLNDAFDDKWDNILSNFEQMIELMASANAISIGSASSISSTLNKILEFYGIDAKQSGIDAYYASGTKSVPKKLRAMIGEAGNEIATTSQGLILTLNPGDGVIPAEMTENLMNMAKGMTVPSIQMARLPIMNAKDSGTNVNQYYDSLIHIDGSADAATVEDLKKLSKNILEESYNYTTKKIYGGYIRSGGKRQL